MLVWTNVRDVLPRTFSHYYMWSSADGKQLTFDQWLDANFNSLDAHVSGLGVPVDRRACEQAALASVIRLFDLFIHMDCVSDFLATLYASLRGIRDARTVRVGYVAPGHAYKSAAPAATRADPRANRSKATWETVSKCTQRKLLDATRCDATFYSMLFGDSRWHRAGWWARSGSQNQVRDQGSRG